MCILVRSNLTILVTLMKWSAEAMMFNGAIHTLLFWGRKFMRLARSTFTGTEFIPTTYVIPENALQKLSTH